MSYSTLVRAPDFSAFLGRSPVVVIAFTDQGSPASRTFEDEWDGFVIEPGDDVVAGVVDIRRDVELARDFGIDSVPTVAIFRERQLVSLLPGAMPTEVLHALVDAVRRVPLDPRA